MFYCVLLYLLLLLNYGLSSDTTTLLVGHASVITKVSVSSGISSVFYNASGSVLDVSVDYARTVFTTLTKTSGTIQCIDSNNITHTLYKDIHKIIRGSLSGNSLVWYIQDQKFLYQMDLQSESCVPGPIRTINLTSPPTSIAQDSCLNRIFWSSDDGSIVALLPDDNDIISIIPYGLQNPTDLLYNYYDHRLYWVDNEKGTTYKIESCISDGSNRVTVFKGENHYPFGLAVDRSNLYWTDWHFMQIWTTKIPDAENFVISDDLRSVSKVSAGRPNGISVFTPLPALPDLCSKDEVIYDTNKFQQHSLTKTQRTSEGIICDCVHGKCMDGACFCSPGFHGSSCNTSACLDYCFYGNCYLRDGKPACVCDNGYLGNRCDDNICNNWCLNNGSCAMVDHSPSCFCMDGFWGVRCEHFRRSSGSCPDQTSNPWLITTLVLSSLLLVLCVILGFLLFRIRKLKIRKIKTRIIGVKKESPPSAAKDIEECCNFNVCETPCEAVILNSSGENRREDKVKLLNCAYEY